MTGVITNQQNTVYAREAYGVASFEWAGKCAALDRVTQEMGGMNVALRQAANGGLEVSGHTDGAPGLVSTTVTFKEQGVQGLGLGQTHALPQPAHVECLGQDRARGVGPVHQH